MAGSHMFKISFAFLYMANFYVGIAFFDALEPNVCLFVDILCMKNLYIGHIHSQSGQVSLEVHAYRTLIVKMLAI